MMSVRDVTKKWTIVLLVFLVCHPLALQSHGMACKAEDKKEGTKLHLVSMAAETRTCPLHQGLNATASSELELDFLAMSHPESYLNASLVPHKRPKRLLSLFAFCRKAKSKAMTAYLPPCVSVSSLVKKLPLKNQVEKQVIPWLRWG